MARVEYQDIIAVLDTDADFEQVKAFVADASLWVDAHLVGKCSALTEPLLAAIEKYLAAHLITARDPRLKSAKRDDISESYVGSSEHDQYLRTAASLDPCGIVARAFMGGRRVRFRVGAGYDHEGGP